MEDLLAQRGITVSYEAIRLWCNKFGPEYARGLKRRQGRLGDTWHLDEVFVTIQGQRQYLWRAVDQDGDVTDHYHPRAAASRPSGRQTLFSQAVEGARSRARPAGDGQAEKLRRWTAHGEVMPSVIHGHQPVRKQQGRGLT